MSTPAAGTYELDPQHSTVEAVARHLMVSKVRGRFADVRGTITIGERPEDSSVEAIIDAASIDTGVADRDTHLRSPDFLDVERFPQITFRSTEARQTGDRSLAVTGDLTIRDVTKPVTLEVDYEGDAVDPWGNRKIALSVRGELDREAFGMTWNVALEAGGVLVSKAFRLEFDIQAVEVAAEQAA